MAVFIPVNYRNKAYPDGIVCPIQEIAGHLDKTSISPKGPYSLHTEYAYGKRKLSSALLKKYPSLSDRHNNHVPQLWYDTKWAEEFAAFVIDLVADHRPPDVIEIHPPFKDYCPTIAEFIERYKVFENIILSHYPDVKICLENRAGTIYKGSSFLISNIASVRDFLNTLAEEELRLKLVMDYPQIFTAEHYDLDAFPMDKFVQSHKSLDGLQTCIQGIHIWGKRKNAKGRWVVHSGDLNSLFIDNQDNKTAFMQLLNEFYDDGIARFFVPEVNSTPAHLQNIVADFLSIGARFDARNV